MAVISSTKNSSNIIMTEKQAIETAKETLRKILKENHGSTKDEKAMEAIEQLSQLWKTCSIKSVSETAKSAPNSKLVLGDWKIISAPDFPNGTLVESTTKDGNTCHKFQYTLGRISFNIFQPKDMLCTIEGIQNFIRNMEQTDLSKEQQQCKGIATYNVLIDLMFHTPNGDFPGEIMMEGYCYPESDTRVTVIFTGGELRKRKSAMQDCDISKLWEQTFANAYKKADMERGYVEQLMQYVMKSVLKLEMPTDDNPRYEMKRVMKGYLDILYLDESFRVTRGNRGSVVVVEKS
uniref:Plastid lipid-associated protein/fibrillin conserved domain-containing protein n=1 Tax=Ditylum brightwellii TaxID=49249 RepID=A0A7S4S9I0_9STRA